LKLIPSVVPLDPTWASILTFGITRSSGDDGLATHNLGWFAAIPHEQLEQVMADTLLHSNWSIPTLWLNPAAFQSLGTKPMATPLSILSRVTKKKGLQRTSTTLSTTGLL